MFEYCWLRIVCFTLFQWTSLNIPSKTSKCKGIGTKDESVKAYAHRYLREETYLLTIFNTFERFDLIIFWWNIRRSNQGIFWTWLIDKYSNRNVCTRNFMINRKGIPQGRWNSNRIFFAVETFEYVCRVWIVAFVIN